MISAWSRCALNLNLQPDEVKDPVQDRRSADRVALLVPEAHRDEELAPCRRRSQAGCVDPAGRYLVRSGRWATSPNARTVAISAMTEGLAAFTLSG